MALSPAISAPLDYAPLTHTTKDCSLCGCVRRGGWDGETYSEERGSEEKRKSVSRKRGWSNGLSLMHLFFPKVNSV